MPRKFTPKVLTANDLLSGDVVYVAEKTRLTRVFSEARLIESEEESQDLLTWAEQQAATLVGPYLADAAKGPDGVPHPVHIRERLRATGPSIDLNGTQSGGQHVPILRV